MFLKKSQIWIINNHLPLDETRIISTNIVHCDIVDEGYIVYLYLAFDDEIETEQKFLHLSKK